MKAKIDTESLPAFSERLLGVVILSIQGPRIDKEMVQIPLEAACGIAQFLQAHSGNLKDVDRIDKLDALGRNWTISFNGEVIGSGRIRSAIDQAITHNSKD